MTGLLSLWIVSVYNNRFVFSDILSGINRTDKKGAGNYQCDRGKNMEEFLHFTSLPFSSIYIYYIIYLIKPFQKSQMFFTELTVMLIDFYRARQDFVAIIVFCNSKMQSLAANLCRTLPTSI
ncbi:hypothetical protein, partial [Brevibacillus borstelensis]|uniref:hypothetical protein n=1 Tax=Brevibacillus borstelensis TaxID=45462 RepID=UPI001E3E7353